MAAPMGRTPPTGLGMARQAADSRMGSMGYPPTPGQPSADTGKKPLGEVNYRAATDPGHACGNCDFFTPPETCDIVAGHIDEAAVCDLWAPVDRGADTGPETMAEDRGEPLAAPPPR